MSRPCIPSTSSPPARSRLRRGRAPPRRLSPHHVGRQPRWRQDRPPTVDAVPHAEPPAASSFSAVRVVPKATAPRHVATCTAARPTPLPTAWMSTDSPAASAACVISASCAVMNASGNAAAAVKSRPVRNRRRGHRGAPRTYSAYEPPPTIPITRSPARHPLTPSPVSAISPANSSPGMSAGRRAERDTCPPPAAGPRDYRRRTHPHEHIARPRHAARRHRGARACARWKLRWPAWVGSRESGLGNR